MVFPCFRHRALYCIAFILVALVLPGCAPTAADKAPEAPAPSVPGQPAQPQPAPLALVETVWAWQYTEENTVRTVPPSPSRYTLIFRGDGRLAVVADCNRGGSAYRVQGEKLALEPVAMTKMLCPNPATDSAFTAGVRAVDRYRVDHQTLTLFSAQGARMVFTPLQP